MFNENVQEIMNSPLLHSFAFVEPIAKPGTKKIFTIDINKCRRNILLNNKDDYCIFNVMDEPKTLNVKSPIFEGLYYIETDNYLPLRGNGWYYHSIVNYCLQHNIITRNQIKYVIKSSSTIDHDYYNGFINYCNDKILSYQEIQDYYNDKVDQNINFEGIEQDDEMHYDMLDIGEYEGIYTVRDKCILLVIIKSLLSIA